MPKPLDRLKESVKKTREKIKEDWEKSPLSVSFLSLAKRRDKEETPRYWGTWKGRVAKAITEYGPLTWGQLRDITGLSRETLNQVLSELYKAKAIEKREDNTYCINHELLKEYQQFLGIKSQEQDSREYAPKKLAPETMFKEAEQDEVVEWIKGWVQTQSLEFSVEPGHFFLIGDYLDNLSRNLILRAKREILIVNPYIQKCSICNSFRDQANNGKSVVLITRNPADSKYNPEEKIEYLKSLDHAGVSIYENNTVHAKLIVVDNRVAIVSSMNLYPASTAGQSWEAGLVTFNENVVADITDAILSLTEQYETKAKVGNA